MFQMFGFGGVKCPRCAHKNADNSGYCAKCGITLGAPRNQALLRENRWMPAPNELALFFGVRDLSAIVATTLRVPATTRAYILQGEQATEVPPGDYDSAGLFARLNHLLRSGHSEILITGRAALAVTFSLDDLETCEHLNLSASVRVSIEIDQVAAFARHFMTLPGSVTAEHLSALLAPSVRQLAAEFVAGQSLRDMARNPQLGAQLDERLQGALGMRVAQYGLAVARVDTLALRHDKLDAQRARIGTLWLVGDGGPGAPQHAGLRNPLYDDAEWARIGREEQDSRLRYRRTELRQDAAIERADLSLHNAERAQAIRAREIDLYSRIVDAKNRKEAIERGAGDVLAGLAFALAKKDAQRGDEAAEWAHLRHIAQIRMRTELEIAQQEALEARQVAQQRFAHALLQQQIGNQVAQALQIEDEVRKRAELERLHASAQQAARRQRDIEAEQHKGQWQSLTLINAAHLREAERVREWEDQVALERRHTLLRAGALEAEEAQQAIAALRRGGAQADAIAQSEKLLRTIAADALHARQGQQLALDAEDARHALKRQAQEAEWQQELRRLEHQREDKFAQLAQVAGHAADMARIEIARGESIGALSASARLALAPAPNAAALADVMKTELHAGMNAQQLAALAGVVGATHSVTAQQGAVMAQHDVQQERVRRDAEVDKDRRHQLDLLALQNDVNKAALAAQAQLGVGVAQGQGHGQGHGQGRAAAFAARQCANGHAAAAGDRFCAQCGAALPP